MEQELFLSGYCRNLDHSRMVCVVTENGKLMEIDCDYPCCPYTKACSIAKQIPEPA